MAHIIHERSCWWMRCCAFGAYCERTGRLWNGMFALSANQGGISLAEECQNRLWSVILLEPVFRAILSCRKVFACTCDILIHMSLQLWPSGRRVPTERDHD